MTNVKTNISGVTLIELVATIVILSIGVTAFLILINQTAIHSIDPVINEQANAAAQSYLEEVMLANFCDPDLSSNCPTDCSAGCNVCGAFSSQAGETRQTFDDVCDYNFLPDNIVRDRLGNQILGNEYTVTVVVDDTGESLNGLDSNNGEVVKIDVTVDHTTTGASVSLTGYRANY